MKTPEYRLAIASLATALSLASGAASAGYVATTWSDNSVHILDDGFNNVSSFAVGASYPNGVATDGSTIWVGVPFASTVRAFDFSGNLLYSWGGSGFANLQGMDYFNGQLAILNANGGEIQFRNALDGTLVNTITGPAITNTIEGIDFDGSTLWAIADQYIYGIDPTTGGTVATIANAAQSCTYGGTGIAAIGNDQLSLACTDGSWYIVSSLTGAVAASGDNDLQMFGLDHFSNVPEPGTTALIGLGLAALATARRRRK